MHPILKWTGYARRSALASGPWAASAAGCRPLDGSGDGQKTEEPGQGDGGDIEDVGDGFFLGLGAEIGAHDLLLRNQNYLVAVRYR